MTRDEETVLRKFAELNGEHRMRQADDEYVKRLFAPLVDMAIRRDDVLAAMAAGLIPLPSYVLRDQESMYLYPDYYDLLMKSGGVAKLRDWYVGHWEDKDGSEATQAWEELTTGQCVALRSVEPTVVKERKELIASIEDCKDVLDRGVDPEADKIRERLTVAVDRLDALETPSTGYDRLRFGDLSRETYIDDVRARYLGGDVYQMTLSLNVLNHLGINLYSNLPAVLSEAVANAWDADATSVSIDIDPSESRVVVSDNGIGMTRREINQRYLNVGYRRRDDERNVAGSTTMRNRPVMGRKGIGKLSLFSIAKTIEVQSRARRPIGDDNAPLQRASLTLDLDEIMDQISGEDVASYTPEETADDTSLTDQGTRLVLTRPRKDLSKTAAHLRRRLARRFAMVSDTFEIYVDGVPITPADRDLAKRCRYLWIFGPQEYQQKVKVLVPNAERIEYHNGITPGGRQVTGWIGSATTSTALQPSDEHDETLNRIAVLVRGKLAQEDVLETISQGGIFTKFLSGEIYADFLDDDSEVDIATSSRQGIVEDDPRFLDFKKFMTERIRTIGTDWNKFRELDGAEDAKKLVPAIETWLEGFTGDTKKYATKFIARVNSIAADNNQRRHLLGSAVIAFERLRRRDRISEINSADDANIPALIEAFKSIDDVEAAMYYDIVQQRLEIIRKFESLTDQNALEGILQKYLFEHLWLLDPAWDRATVPEMEKTIAKVIADKTAPKDRLDIKYRKVGGQDVIVELKRAGRTVSTTELQAQTEKYRNHVVAELRRATGDESAEVQIVCVVGRDLSDWKDRDGRERSRNALRAYNTRVVMYQELVDNALQSYQEYIEINKEVGAIRDILHAMENQLVAPDDTEG